MIVGVMVMVGVGPVGVTVSVRVGVEVARWVAVKARVGEGEVSGGAVG